MKRVVAIYPGSFDPLTNGHLDLIRRGSKIFDELIVAILRNPEKAPLFTLEERRQMLEQMTARWRNVRIDTFDGLLVQYAMRQKAHVVLRGIRAISDYEYELQMALMNRRLEPDLETVFMMPAEAYSYVSSRLVKEIAQLGGSVHGLVPDFVEQRLRQKLNWPPVKKRAQKRTQTEPEKRLAKRRAELKAYADDAGDSRGAPARVTAARAANPRPAQKMNSSRMRAGRP
jgi:pantetheine-phosphate adenylyltransferase